jgi:hypothetical protein
MKRTFMMNDRSGAGRAARRQPRFRLAALTAAVASAALLAAACGGSSSTTAQTAQIPTLQSMTTKALAYAQCMRSHGITNFPDPTVQDNAHEKGVGFSIPGSIQNSPQFKSAGKACQKQTGFGRPNPAVLQALMAHALKFAVCIRSHGITNYPDPVENSHGVSLGAGPGTNIDTSSPRFKAAQKACVYLLPNGGP